MKKQFGVLAILSVLFVFGISSISAGYTGSDSRVDPTGFNYEQHPDKGPAVHFVTIELVCRDNIDQELLLYRIRENNKSIGYFYARGFLHVQDAIEIYEQPRHVHYIWSYKDINSKGQFKKLCN